MQPRSKQNKWAPGDTPPKFDKQNNTMNAAPGFGRGYMGTTPAPHAVNSMVTFE